MPMYESRKYNSINCVNACVDANAYTCVTDNYRLLLVACTMKKWEWYQPFKS